MDQTIMFTPYELWTAILAICGGVIAISGAATVIFKILSKAKEPEMKQNERIFKCEEKIVEFEHKLEIYDQHFDHDKKRLDRLEFGNEAENRALLALLNHAINGNNEDELKNAKRELEQYLLSGKRVVTE